MDRVFDFVVRDTEAEFGYDEGERVAHCLNREDRRLGQTPVDLYGQVQVHFHRDEQGK